MYEQYYGLKSAPFALSPDHRLFFNSEAHQRALAHLRYGLHQGEGFIVITGEVGCGKTTLVQHLLAQLDTQHYLPAHVVSTNLDHEQLLRMIAVSFGIDDDGLSKASMIHGLEFFAREAARHGRRCLIFIDEAQNLTRQSLEEMRMLSNLMVDGQPAFQSFLLGQPQLRQILADPELDQLRQRVIASYHLGPLQMKDSALYILHRLKQVGWTGNPDFTKNALAKIHVLTGGVPRKINTLSNRLMLRGYLDELSVFDEALVAEVAAEMTEEIGEVVDNTATFQNISSPDGHDLAGGEDIVLEEFKFPEATLKSFNDKEAAQKPEAKPGLSMVHPEPHPQNGTAEAELSAAPEADGSAADSEAPVTFEIAPLRVLNGQAAAEDVDQARFEAEHPAPAEVPDPPARNTPGAEPDGVVNLQDVAPRTAFAAPGAGAPGEGAGDAEKPAPRVRSITGDQRDEDPAAKTARE
ncbi:MAG: XrtA/PEP-CTERM system-associated ATPase, partial [Pseudomonadota bacterium]